jgi:hypothetical protein
LSTLAEKARAAASANGASKAEAGTGADTSAVQDRVALLDPIEYTGPIATADQVPVHVAFARVMADVQSVRKDDHRNDTGGRYNFRGVDRVVNAVGPALRRHGVLVLPGKILSVEYRETRTKSGSVMQDCTITVQWTVVGPMGDVLPTPLESAGQATDTQDKATSKATSVAQRVLFLSALHIPTEDPTIDQGHDRGEAPQLRPADVRDEAVNPATSLGRLRQMRGEVQRHGMARALVTNEVGDEEELLALIDRIGRERRPTASEVGGGEAS